MLGSVYTASMIARLKSMGGTVAVVCGGVTTDGLVDFEAVETPGEFSGVSGANRVVLVPATALPALTHGASLTVDGSSFRARDVRPHGDGELVRVEISK